MIENTPVGPWVRRFLMDYLLGDRNLAANTRCSYRDALALLLKFTSGAIHKHIDALVLEDVTAERIRDFLSHLEQDRGCSIPTRNQRLAAIRMFARFVADRSPEHIAWCTGIRSVPLKKASSPGISYLEKPEMDAILNAAKSDEEQSQRDYAILLFLYNTGARADEVARATIQDLDLHRPSSVKIEGKGRKVRYCPLWASTVRALKPLVAGRPPSETVFMSRSRRALTRFGVRSLVKRFAERAGQQCVSLQKKDVSPHTIRHTTAVHLLRAGVDINTIRAWLGHVSLDTTNIYAEVDLEMKAKALAACAISERTSVGRWRRDPGLMEFLRDYSSSGVNL